MSLVFISNFVSMYKIELKFFHLYFSQADTLIVAIKT